MNRVLYKTEVIIYINSDKEEQFKKTETEHTVYFENEDHYTINEGNIFKNKMFWIIFNHNQNPIMKNGLKIIHYSEGKNTEVVDEIVILELLNRIEFLEDLKTIAINNM